MKVRIVRETHCEAAGGLIPTMMIHEFEGAGCGSVAKTIEDGVITIGVKAEPTASLPYKVWPHIRTIYKDEPHPSFPKEREEIIVYVVKDD